MASAVGTGSVPTVHVAGIAPPVAKPKKDPCRHRRNKKKKTKYLVYIAAEDTGKKPKTGNYYVGRTRGTGTINQIKNNRERGHHRTDIGKLQVVCSADTYSACRGAEQKHYNDMVSKGKAITSPRKKGRGAQIAPIADDNPKKQDYEDCAKASALNGTPPPCPICSA